MIKLITLTRKLKDYVWSLEGKTVIAYDKETKTKFVFDKVRLMSFMKFAINCLDKMRIEESKLLRTRIKKIRENYKKREDKRRGAGKQERLLKS